MNKQNNIILLALILSAASGLIYEVVATHILFFYFIRSTYSISTVLSIFLLGLGIGSFLIYKLKDRIVNKKQFFAILQILIGTYAAVILFNLPTIIKPIHPLGIFISSFFILLIPTIALGAIFPLSGKILKKKDSIGLIYSVDLGGAVAGSLIAGFLLIPELGYKSTILFAAMLNIIASALMLKGIKKIIPGIIAIILIITMLTIQTTELNPENFNKASPYGTVLFEDNTMFIDGREQCSPDYIRLAGERVLANNTLSQLNTPEAKVLNIGLGCGLTLQQILERTNEEVDVVEINPVVVELNKLISNVLQNKNVNLIINEGLNYLRNTEKKYDAIIIDIENPAVIHSSEFYTQESFEIIKKSLNEEGVFGLWSYYCGEQEYYDIMYYTLRESFSHVYYVKPDNFIASDKKLEYPEYIPQTEKQINTLDKKPLTKLYFQKCKWWEEEQNIIKF